MKRAISTVFMLLGLVATVSTYAQEFPSEARSREDWREVPQLRKAFERGDRQASKDARRGNFRLRAGLAFSSYDERLYRVLRQEYGVQVKVVMGCMESPRLMARSAGYNERMIQILEGRYGVGWFEQLFDRVFSELHSRPRQPGPHFSETLGVLRRE